MKIVSGTIPEIIKANIKMKARNEHQVVKMIEDSSEISRISAPTGDPLDEKNTPHVGEVFNDHYTFSLRDT